MMETADDKPTISDDAVEKGSVTDASKPEDDSCVSTEMLLGHTRLDSGLSVLD